MKRLKQLLLVLLICILIPTCALCAEMPASDTFDTSDGSVLDESLAANIEAPVDESPEIDLIAVFASGSEIDSSDETASTENTDPSGDDIQDDSEAQPEPSPIATVTIPSKITLGVGQKYTLSPVVTPDDAEGILTFSSGSKKNAAVGKSSGTITAKKTGKATITVKADTGAKDTCKVTVKKAPSKITLKTARTTLGAGEFSKVTYSLTKGTAAGVTFTSSDPSVLFVDEDGNIAALSPGTATITAKTHNKKKAAKKFTVNPAPESISLNACELTLPQGQTFQLTPTLTEGSTTTISWLSGDSGVVTVDKNGLVTCAAPGTATITATTHNGHQAACTFTVKPGPTEITFDISKRTMGKGETYALAVSVANSETEDYISDYTITSSKKSVASVSEDGLITAKKAGTATITAKAPNGVKATCKITVKNKPSSVKFASGSYGVYAGSTKSTKLKFPSGQGGSVTYSSSNESIATVDSSGKVTGILPGSATITVKTYNGKTAKCKIRVYQDVGKLMGKESGQLEILFMDIGRNDGILLQCGGEYAFIDSGMASNGAQALKEMKRIGVTKLKYYIGTHAHADHVEGAPTILAGIPTEKVIVPHKGVTNMIKNKAKTSAQKKAVKKVDYDIMKFGNTIKLGDATLTCVGPTKITSVKAGSVEENGNSLVLKVAYGSRTVLLTGDATSTELYAIHKKSPGILKADVLKNPHHNGKLDKTTIKRIKPAYVVFSTHKKYLPSSSYLKILKGVGAKYFITASNKHSHTLFVTDGENMTFYTKKPS